MNAEYDDLIASFRIDQDLEQAVALTIQSRLTEFTATPMTALPLADDDLVEQHASLRVKRVDCRVIERLRAA